MRASASTIGCVRWARARSPTRMLAAIDNADRSMANLDLDRAFAEDPSSVDPGATGPEGDHRHHQDRPHDRAQLERPMALEGDND